MNLLRDWMVAIYLLGTTASVWLTLKMSYYGINEMLVKATSDPYQVLVVNLLGYAVTGYLFVKYTLVKWLKASGAVKYGKKDENGNEPT